MRCPDCGRENENGAPSCACGYQFPSRSTAPPAATLPSGSVLRALAAVVGAVVGAMVAACVLPTIVSMVQSKYSFSLQIYWEVFVHRHHDVRTWVERGWPDIVFPISALIAPFVGGIILQALRTPAGSAPRRHSFLAVVVFSVSYALAVILAGALAGTMHPYAFRWSDYVQFLGVTQVLTLLLLGVALSTAGAAAAARVRAHRGQNRAT